MPSSNIWDDLGKSSFNTHLDEDEIDPRAADNILLAWPPMIDLIVSRFPPSKGTALLDYGCGTGGFCKKMGKMGFSVTGIDSSMGMIETAKYNSPSDIAYILGDQSAIPATNKYHIITSIMTFQFIEKLDPVIQSLQAHLQPGGLFLLADFNKEWVKECLKIPISFADFDSNDDPVNGWKIFGEARTPVYIRTAEEYENLLRPYGFEKVLEAYPPFTEEFVEKYPDKRPKNKSEFLILGYKKE